MAIKKQIDISVDARSAISQMDELGSSFEDVFGEVKPLNAKIGEMEDALYQLASAGDTSSKEFKDLSKTVGDYKKVIIETDMQIDAMSQTTSQNLGGSIEGVAGAFSIGMGAMGAFGVESEAVGEALVKIQSAMAITQGIQSVREGAKAFRGMKAAIMASTVVQKALNLVMNANPIGLIVAGVTLLIGAVVALWSPIKNLMGAWMGFSDTSEKVAEDMEKINTLFEKQNKLIDESIKNLKKKIEQNQRSLKIEGASEAELHNQRLTDLKTLESARIIQKNDIENQNKAQYILLERARKFNLEDEIETIKTTIESNRSKYDELKLQDGDYALSKSEAEKAERERIKAENSSDYEAYKSRIEAKKELDKSTARAIEDARLENREESEAKEQEANMIAFKRFQEDTLANTKLTEQQKQDLIDAAAEKGRLKRIEINAKYKAIDEQAVEEARIADAEKAALDLEVLTVRLDAESEVKKEALAKQVQDNKEAEEEKQKQVAAGFEATKQGLEAAQAIANLMFDSQLKAAEGNEAKQEIIRRKAFNANKAVSLSLAVIQGVQSVMGAYTSANANVAATASSFGAYPVIMASLAGVFSAVNIAKIASSQYKGGNSGGATLPSGGGGAASIPQFNVVGNSPQNQLAQSLGQNKTPIKAFVVSGDVTSAQSLERNAIRTASL
tara:strand:- start:313 stop:2331 length:2019 start_codon:yes stop_codon:yes gene_type:complete